MSIRHNALFSDLCDDIARYLEVRQSPRSVVDLQLLGSGIQSTIGWVPSDLPVEEYACMQLLTSFLKKFQDGHEATADKAALDKFLASNMYCKDWVVKDDRSMEEDLLLGLFRQEVYRFFYRGSGGHILGNLITTVTGGDVGPGSSIMSNGSDFYSKLFSGPLSTTSESLYDIYSRHVSNLPYWKHAESLRATEFGEFVVVEGNRLSFVPKNVDTSRCICTEPLLNMFFQKGVQATLERRLKQYFNIDLANQQECNKDLAQLGSMNDRFCTIDLSSASDTVSLRMIRELFPREVTAWLEFFRSKKVQLPSGSWEELHMISSMGNAFTFPLETIIFACVVSSAYRMKDVSLSKGYRLNCEFDRESGAFVQTKHLPNFGVFGDDIIVLQEHYRHTMMLLKLLGFTANEEKSFSSGPFRESCGGDYFRGHPVRGVYVKTLKTQASRYVAINRLNEWSALQGIPLPRTIARLMKSVRYLPVPLYENDDAGVKVPYHMVEGLKRDADTQAILYRRWESVSQKIAIKDGALKLPKNAKHRIFNGDGLLVAMLRGDVRNDTLGSRLGAAKYRSREALTSNWNWVPSVAGCKNPVGQTRLTAAIETNLTS